MTIPSSYLFLPGLLAAGALTLISGEEKKPLMCEPEAPAPECVTDPAPDPERPLIEVAFVLDTTGSMGGLIEGAKAKIWSIASRIVQGNPTPRLRVGLVGYRDLDDAYVTRTFPLREDLDAVFADLRSFQAAGGGDTPEHVALALEHAVEKMQWSSGSDVLKIIYLVGDAPPQRYPSQLTAADWTQKARARGIIVNTVRCGGSAVTQQVFQTLAQIGGGAYFAVAQDGGMVATRTPFDDEIRRLEAESGSLSMVGGAAPARARSAKKRDRMSSLPASVGADRSAFHIASGRGARRWVSEGAVDLAAEPEALERLDEEALPADLKPLAPAERKAKVAKRARRRAEVDRRLEVLLKQRGEYLEMHPPAPDAVDDHVFSDIKGHAGKLGVTY
jgi:hypothetical protein